MTDDVTNVIAAHRRVADLLEQHPDIALPFVYGDGKIAWNIYSFECPDGIPAMVAKIRRIVGGKWDKRESKSGAGSDEMIFEREGYQITTRREAVCVRRVVGTETVTKPAVNLPERTETRPRHERPGDADRVRLRHDPAARRRDLGDLRRRGRALRDRVHRVPVVKATTTITAVPCGKDRHGNPIVRRNTYEVDERREDFGSGRTRIFVRRPYLDARPGQQCFAPEVVRTDSIQEQRS